MIGRFYLKINNYVVPRVSHCRVSKFARNESRTTSFAGSDRVDRSALKYRLSARVALLSAAEMQTIQAAAENITATVQFYDGANLVQKTMIIDLPDTPEPWYKYGDRTKGVYYTNYDLTMEEA